MNTSEQEHPRRGRRNSSKSKKEKARVVDRRQSRRFKVSWQIVIRGSDRQGNGFEETGALQDLSASGMFCYLEHRVSVGARLDVLIRVPFKRENWMKYSARVVRAEPEDARMGVAARFDGRAPSFSSSSLLKH
jgi:hypothetical protein